MSDVDSILNNWFGEPLEHSDNERTLTRHLYEPLREIERQRDQLLAALKLAEKRLIAKCEGNLVTFNGEDVDTLTAIRTAIRAVKK